MFPFLKAVARAYATRYDDMSRFCFVFPNKRGGTFFLKYLRSEMKTAHVAPQVMTVTDFVAQVGDAVVDNRISALFTLFDCYCRFLPPDSEPDFDSFRTWGETVLSDFNEVGMNCADPSMLFKNLKDHKEISSDFLTEEQKKIMEEYFGVTPSLSEAHSFWRHFNNPTFGAGSGEHGLSDPSVPQNEDKKKGNKIPLRGRFLKLWEILNPLYESFNKTLAEKGLTTSSGAYRKALSALEERGRVALPWEKIVFVGFNALTHVEHDIFSILRDLGPMATGRHPEDSLADFFWDATGPVLNRTGRESEGIHEKKSVKPNSASRFVVANRRRFPEPDWSREIMSLCETSSLPQSLRSIAAPSNSIQAKIAADEVTRIFGGRDRKKMETARVAVILPDEELLLPFLYALPEDISDVNLTMGYSLRLTSVSSFIGQIRQTLRSSRIKEGDTSYYLPDLRLLLAHPLAKAIGGTKPIEDFLNKAELIHQIFVSGGQLRREIPSMDKIFSPPPASGKPADTFIWLEEVLEIVDRSIENVNQGLIRTALDSEHVAAYLEGLRPLRTALANHNVSMSRDTLLSMAQRLVGTGRVMFEGEPLRGLQVMGLLETRSLDFDIVVIPSLNERILPMRSRSRTFIPDALRAAYGLPPANYAENIFAYYFYRLISRAKEVVMIHDARSGSGLRSGGPSRYIHQLEHIFAKDVMITEERTFSLSDFTPEIEPIEKTEAVKEKLREYLVSPESPDPTVGRCLSATAVNDYCTCQKRFFFKHIVGIPEQREFSPFVDHIQLGNVVHRVMQILYSPVPLHIDIPFIDNLLREDNKEILLVTTRSMTEEFPFLKHRSYLPPDYEIVRSAVVRMVRGILRADRELCAREPSGGFDVLGTEAAGVEIMKTSRGRQYRFRYAIDRADTAGGHLRIVDYKTGTTHASGKDFEEMFNGESTSMTNFLQLMAYAGIARRKWPALAQDGIGMVLYRVTEMARETVGKIDTRFVIPSFNDIDRETGEKVTVTFESDCKTVRKVGRVSEEEIDDRYREEFDVMFGDKIDTLFDSPDFSPTANSMICGNCPYARFCLK